jgi:hypothetical protein
VTGRGLLAARLPEEFGTLWVLRGYLFSTEIITHAVWLYHRFALCRRDIDELLAERGIQVSYDARGDKDTVGTELATVGQAHQACHAPRLETASVLNGDDFGAEPPGLRRRSAGQFGSADSGRKSQVVFDAGALAGLASGRFALNQHGPQTFGRAAATGPPPRTIRS